MTVMTENTTAKRAQGLFQRCTWVDTVQLIELDALKLEATEAHFDTLDQVTGAADVLGFGGALASDAALGGNDKAGRVGMQCLADKTLGDLRAIGVGGIDESDAELDSAAENATGFTGILRLAPCTFADQAHGSVTETVDREVASDSEFAARGGGESGHGGYDAIRSGVRGQGLGSNGPVAVEPIAVEPAGGQARMF